MKYIIWLIIGIFTINAVTALDFYYELDLHYSNGTITQENIEIKPFTGNELKNLIGGYIAEIKSFDDEVLNLTFFNIPLLIIYDSFDEEGHAISGGTIVLEDMLGNTESFTVHDGQILPCQPVRVYSTGTTASNIIALK